MLADPREQLATIGAIDPDAPQLLAVATQALKQQLCAYGIRDTCCRHDHRQEQAYRIDQQMTLAALDHLAIVIATHARNLGCLDALTVQTACRRVLVASG